MLRSTLRPTRLTRHTRTLLRSLTTGPSDTPTPTPETKDIAASVDDVLTRLRTKRITQPRHVRHHPRLRPDVPETTLVDYLQKLSSSDSVNVKALEQVIQHLPRFVEHGLQRDLLRAMLEVYEKDETLLAALRERLGVRGVERKHHRNLMLELYINTGHLEEAFKFVKEMRIDTPEGEVLPILVERLVQKHIHSGSIFRAHGLVTFTESTEKYRMGVGTYAQLLRRAIGSGNSGICQSIYTSVIDKTYVDNGTLVALAETLSYKITSAEMSRIYGIAQMKRSMSPELWGRMKVAVVENMAQSKSFKSGLKLLTSVHTKGTIYADDYPMMMERMTLSQNEDRLYTTLKEFVSTRGKSYEVNRFYLAMAMGKLVKTEKLSLALRTLLRKDQGPGLMGFVSEDAVWQLVKGLRVTKNQEDYNLFAKVMTSLPFDVKLEEEMEFPIYMKFHKRFALDKMVECYLKSAYWFKLFGIFRYIGDHGIMDDYKLRPEHAEQLREKLGSMSDTQNVERTWSEFADEWVGQ